MFVSIQDVASLATVSLVLTAMFKWAEILQFVA